MPETATQVRTNTTPNSIHKVAIKPITFAELWANYVHGNPYNDKSGAYDNQCAIRLSATLHRVGVDMKSFNQKNVKPAQGSKTIGKILLNGKATATRAEEMGAWLDLRPFAGLNKAENITGADWQSKIVERTGIIAFCGYWTRPGETEGTGTGGHIDLWNGSRMTYATIGNTLAATARGLGFQQGSTRFFSWSDLGKSKNIQFWEIK